MISEKAGSDFLELIVDRLAEKLLPEIIERLALDLPETKNVTMDIKEAAEYIGISKELLYQLCSEGSIPHLKLGSNGTRKKRILFSSKNIDIWRREQEFLSLRKD